MTMIKTMIDNDDNDNDDDDDDDDADDNHCSEKRWSHGTILATQSLFLLVLFIHEANHSKLDCPKPPKKSNGESSQGAT